MTAQQEYLLICLMEECGEIIQAASKALRFGLDNNYPGTDRTNVGDISKEFNDLYAVRIMLSREDVHIRYDDRAVLEKIRTIEEFLEKKFY